MHQRQPRALRGGDTERALEIGWLEAGVTVDMPFTGARQNQALDERRAPGLPGTWMPKSKAEVFLTVGAEQVPPRRGIKVLRHRHAARHPAHCESQSRQTWLIYAATVFLVLPHSWKGRDQ
jgi:hypothetical protein